MIPNLEHEMQGVWCYLDDVGRFIRGGQLGQDCPPLLQDPFLIEEDVVGEIRGYLVKMLV